MSELKTDAERIDALEKAIEGLKGFDKRISCVVGLIVLAAAVWGYFKLWEPVSAAEQKIVSLRTDQDSLSKSLAIIEIDIESRKQELKSLTASADAAKRAAGDAMAKAGSLEIAVGEAKRAARESLDASERAERANKRSLEVIEEVKTIAQGAEAASKGSSQASQEANRAAQAASDSLEDVRRLAEYAKALTDDMDKNMKGYDRKIAVLSTTFSKIREMLKRVPQPQPSGTGANPAPLRRPPEPARPAAQRKIRINITGAGAMVDLNPGAALLDSYSVSAPGYMGEFLIPDGAIVELTIDASGVMVTAHRSLRGRIIDKRTKNATGAMLSYK